jgi:hypothetical protein
MDNFQEFKKRIPTYLSLFSSVPFLFFFNLPYLTIIIVKNNNQIKSKFKLISNKKNDNRYYYYISKEKMNHFFFINVNHSINNRVIK